MSKPNFVIFLTDDQGYGDLSCMGCTDFETPNIDSLAQGGARFTDWYANGPVCSPTRASVLTGRYPCNAGVRSVLRGHRTATGLPPQVPALPKVLKEHGYRTYLAGKWHLGVQEASRPHNHGFDHWCGFLAGCIDYYSHIFYWEANKPGPGRNPVHDLWEDNCERWENGRYFTELVTEKAVNYLQTAVAADAPFLLCVHYNAPHYPMHAPAEYMQRFAHLPWDRQVMAAMLAAVDDGVGRIRGEMQRLGVAENTVTLFMSDNGPSRESRNWLDGTLDPYYGGTSGRLKGHKASLFDGGIRVPGIMNWPARIRPGRVLTAPCTGADVFPTMLAAAGGNPDTYELDGNNILPYLENDEPPAGRDIYWEFGEQTAMRRGPWKLVLNGKLTEGVSEADAVHLSNLDEDMGETQNRKDENPAFTEELKRCAESWRADVEARWQREFSPARQGTVTH